MPFNTALSGIRAANDDLRLTGNNIANASTTGFKESRAEFGDVYSTTVLGSGLNQVGSGVRIQDVAQQFSQGNISFTENVLDLAISGSGFFVTEVNGSRSFTRSGTFGLDNEGNVVNNINGRLQGFLADSNGNLGTLPTDIQIETSNLQPQSTTQAELELNLDSRQPSPQTAFTIPAARIATLDGADVTIGITNPNGISTNITIATSAGAGDDTATTIASLINAATGVQAVNNGGDVEIILSENYLLTTNPTVGGSAALTNSQSTALSIGFDATDANSYNHSTAVTIYDSLGNPHIMQQFFIKQPYDPANAATTANHWQMVVQIDGYDVGAPTNALDPVNTATSASYDLFFTPNGSLDEVTTGDIDIVNWTPLDANGNQIGAFGPSDTPSSNFQVALTGTTQVGSDFEVRSVNQDGTTTGRLAGINIDDTGVIFARYTNGQNRVLAQVVLADFANTQGLQSAGDTSWSESSSSGEPVIGGPGTASLGLIQSSALEESNVELSEQLVNLIIAQRNFQASAKTIETADQTTQTIINLR